MAEITATLVKELREKTGAGMMDCKKALTESAGDLENAVDWLRKKGLAAAAKKSSRAAAEGLVGAVVKGKVGAVVEVNAETDFVSRNDRFQGFVAQVTELALAGHGDVDGLKEAAYPGTGHSVADELTKLIGAIGENMVLRRAHRLQVSQGVVASYVHGQVAPNQGKIGVLVALESAADPVALAAFGKQLAMHVAAANPKALSPADVDQSMLERERAILTEQAAGSGKAPEIVAKMVEGRLRKYYEEVCLLEQVYVIDGESRVKQAVEAQQKKLGKPIKVTDFVRLQLGEGVEKEKGDFAAEVAAAAGKK
jgi:elongation factor Ts